MITILHGDHQVASRDRLNDLKSDAKLENREIMSLEGPSLELTNLVQSVESQSLFNEQRTVVVDNLLSSLKAGAKRDEIVGYLLKGNFDSGLILWEKGSVGRQLIKLKKAPHVTIEEFKMPTVIFTFVDSLGPNNSKALVSSLQEIVQARVVPEIIFAMIVRQFRLMLALHTNASISEIKRIAPWQKGKLSKQASLFSLEQLKRLYKELLIIDYQIKTGQSAFDLSGRIEQFILSLDSTK